MNRTHKIAALVGMAAALGVTTGPASAEKMRLLYSQWLPAQHFTQKIIHAYFKQIAKATDGRVQIVLSSKALGPPPRQMQLVVDGVADIAWGLHGYQPGVYPLSEMVELPFVSTNAEANSIAYWEVYKKVFSKAGMHPSGVHTLTLHVHPPGNIYNNKRPLLTLADFKGLKLRATNSTVFRLFKFAGAVPIAPSGGVTALHQGLAKGIVDGTSFTDDGITTFRLTRYIKYATLVPGGLYNSSFYMVISKKKWEAISAADRAAITALSGARLGAALGAEWKKQIARASGVLKEKGVRFDTANKALLNAFAPAVTPIRDAWFAKAAKANVDGKAALALYERLSRSD